MFNANKRVMQSSSWMHLPETSPPTLLSLETKEKVKTENQMVQIMRSLTELNQTPVAWNHRPFNPLKVQICMNLQVK